MPKLNTRIQSKHDVEANWALAENFKPLAGEVIVYDVDSNHAYPRFKVGDGKTLVSALPFSTDVLDKYVTLDTTQTITGAKTFSQQVIVPETPTANTHASSKGYVDTTVTGAVNGTREQLEKEIGLVENSVADLQSNMANITNVDVQTAGGTSLGTVLGPSSQGTITIPTIAGPTGPTGAAGRAALTCSQIKYVTSIPVAGSEEKVDADSFNRTPIFGDNFIWIARGNSTLYGRTWLLYCTIKSILISPFTVSIDSVMELTGPTGSRGYTGPTGPTGATGQDGEQGVSITGATLEFDGTLSDGSIIPTPTTADNGKVLGVTNGAYALQEAGGGGATGYTVLFHQVSGGTIIYGDGTTETISEVLSYVTKNNVRMLIGLVPFNNSWTVSDAVCIQGGKVKYEFSTIGDAQTIDLIIPVNNECLIQTWPD